MRQYIRMTRFMASIVQTTFIMMTKTISKLTIELDGIGHTLQDNKLSVPIYQRSYAWEESHVTDLYDDLLTSIRENEDEYFIGSLVISSGANGNEVVDGQQRLATISILLAAIRDYFISVSDSERAIDLQNQYLSAKDRRTLEVIPNLTLNNADHHFFHNNVVITPPLNEQATKASHRRLKAAYSIAKEKIRYYVATVNNPVTALLDLCDFIDKKLRIIIVKVPNHANAFTIFETLNDRGLELAISDLLKNYLLGQADNRIGEVQESWTKMYALLENSENEGLVVTFLRHYWSSANGLTRERELYKKIKEKITSKQRAIDFSNHLEDAAKTYVALIDTTSTYWNDFSIASRAHMETLNLFGMTQIRPLLMAVLSQFEKKESEKALHLLVNICVRFLVYGGLGGGALEAHFSETAKNVTNGTVPNAKQLKLTFNGVIPSDTQFKEAFSKAAVAKATLARYYLVSLENAQDESKKPEQIPNNDTLAVNLEHVLPKVISQDWPIDPDTHRAYLKRLGNLAIMGSKLNSEIGNGSFQTKREHYLKSSFVFTKSIGESVNWGAKEINERQDKMAELALKAWKI
jgi:uncharacterized protein with ParB-like and HNH nuclease domain